MADRLIIDTDVLIDLLRDSVEATEFIRQLKVRPFLSAITVAELYSGVRDGPERDRLDILVSGFRVLTVTRDLAVAGGSLARQYRLSHGTGLPDAIIAATVQAQAATLVTLNSRHFPMIADLLVPYRKA